jgi:exopolyphosphatase / guanosine-5'-triphosphate,3'-diphosphate pyrophosphatase
MAKKIAIIDLGTNTFNLLIIEIDGNERRRLHSKKVGVALGMGGINDGQITIEASSRAIITLKEYKQKCTEMGVDEIKCFATSAVRSASNRDHFLQAVKDEVELTIKVVSGQEEANLIYQGVSSGYTFEENALIMDIGGGSTEFIWADSGGIKKARSFEIGVSRIFQLYEFQDPYSEADVAKVENYLTDQIGDFFKDIQSEILIGASGSFETFYELYYQRPFPDNVYMEMQREQFESAVGRIIASTRMERDINEFIIPIRKKMAPIAAIKIRWIIRKLDINKIIISPYSLKEGVIQSII